MRHKSFVDEVKDLMVDVLTIIFVSVIISLRAFMLLYYPIRWLRDRRRDAKLHLVP